MNLLIAQCGGPTAVINASLAALVEAAQTSSAIGRVQGARLGLEGLLAGDWVDLTGLTPDELARLRVQPGAALGGGRYRPSAAALDRTPAWLVARGIDAVVLIGGGGTMAAAQALDAAARAHDVPLQIVGVPKTIDNDLAGTEVAPGYGSAARFIARMTRDAGLDLRAMRHFDDVMVVEVMGRHAGWLAAAAALARARPDDPPHLILLPEAPLEEERLLAHIAAIHRRAGYCLVVAAEGVRDLAGRFLAEKAASMESDASGQPLLSLAAGVAPYLARCIRQTLGLHCRQVRPDTLQRSCSALASPLDRKLAALAATGAVHALVVEGRSAIMAGLTRNGTGWRVRFTPLADLAGRTRPLPSAFRDDERFDVTSRFLEYARPFMFDGDDGDAPLVW